MKDAVVVASDHFNIQRRKQQREWLRPPGSLTEQRLGRDGSVTTVAAVFLVAWFFSAAALRHGRLRGFGRYSRSRVWMICEFVASDSSRIVRAKPEIAVFHNYKG